MMRLIIFYTIFMAQVAYVTSECLRGRWGINSQYNCPSKCYNNTCNGTTGLCDDGCLGYSNPPVCDKNCSYGFFGKNCKEECPVKCQNRSCDQFTGNCHQCMDGYSGDRCSEEQFSTNAIIGISIGCALFVIIAIIIIIVICKRNSDDSGCNWRGVIQAKSCIQSNQS